MPVRLSIPKLLVTLALMAATAACGSSKVENPSDPDSSIMVRDAFAWPEAAPEVALPRLDLAAKTVDAGAVDAPASEAGRPSLDATAPSVDLGAAILDASPGQVDTAPDAADAAFQPGPATPIVVNSANTAQFNLGDGTWKIFYFDTEAGQLYVVSGLDGISRGYLSTSATVSPSNYEKATDVQTGKLYFTAPSAQRYYLAVGVSGGGASGSFQVADGGRVLALGTTTLSLSPADAGDAYLAFRFPVTAGHGYVLDLKGPYQPELGLAVAPSPERSTLGEFSHSNWGVGGGLPFSNEAITAAQVADSTCGFYFVNLRIMGAITFTITIAEAP